MKKSNKRTHYNLSSRISDLIYMYHGGSVPVSSFPDLIYMYHGGGVPVSSFGFTWITLIPIQTFNIKVTKSIVNKNKQKHRPYSVL